MMASDLPTSLPGPCMMPVPKAIRLGLPSSEWNGCDKEEVIVWLHDPLQRAALDGLVGQALLERRLDPGAAGSAIAVQFDYFRRHRFEAPRGGQTFDGEPTGDDDGSAYLKWVATQAAAKVRWRPAEPPGAGGDDAAMRLAMLLRERLATLQSCIPPEPDVAARSRFAMRARKTALLFRRILRKVRRWAQAGEVPVLDYEGYAATLRSILTNALLDPFGTPASEQAATAAFLALGSPPLSVDLAQRVLQQVRAGAPLERAKLVDQISRLVLEGRRHGLRWSTNLPPLTDRPPSLFYEDEKGLPFGGYAPGGAELVVLLDCLRELEGRLFEALLAPWSAAWRAAAAAGLGAFGHPFIEARILALLRSHRDGELLRLCWYGPPGERGVRTPLTPAAAAPFAPLTAAGKVRSAGHMRVAFFRAVARFESEVAAHRLEKLP